MQEKRPGYLAAVRLEAPIYLLFILALVIQGRGRLLILPAWHERTTYGPNAVPLGRSRPSMEPEIGPRRTEYASLASHPLNHSTAFVVFIGRVQDVDYGPPLANISLNCFSRAGSMSYRTLPILLCLTPALLAEAPPKQDLQALLASPPLSFPADRLMDLARSLPADPMFGVIQLVEDNRFLLDEENRLTATYHYIFRVDHESALSGWGRLQVAWQPWLNARPTIRARVITPDGQVHFLNPDTLGESTAQDESQDAFGDRRILRGPLPQLQVGAVAEVEVQVRDQRPFARSGLRRTFPLAYPVPVHASRLVLETPASTHLKHRIYGLSESAIRFESSRSTRRMTVDQGLTQPPMAREPYEDWDEEPVGSLLVTTADTWAAVADEYRALVDPILDAASMNTVAAGIVGSARNRDEKIQRILKYVQQKVRYIALEFGESAIVPRRPEETLARGYGDCKDQSTLLVALLRAAGIEAHVALLRAGESRDFTPEFPGLSAFNHAIVHVPGRKPIWIDPTVPQARLGQIPPGVAGRNALIIAPGTHSTVQLPPFNAAANCEVQTREVFLAASGPGRIVETTEARDVAEIIHRAQFSGVDPTRLRENLKSYVKNVYRSDDLGEIALTDAQRLEMPWRLRLEVPKAGIAATETKAAQVALNPWPLVNELYQALQPGDPDPREKQAESKDSPKPRRTRLLLVRPWSEEHRWILHPPDGYANEALPNSRTLTFGPASLDMSWSRGAEGTVEARFRFTCDRLGWSPAEVDQARAALKVFGEEPSPTVVFQHRGEAYLEAGLLKEAMAEFRRLSSRHPADPEPLVRLAQAELSIGLAEPAISTLTKAIALDPKAEQPHRQLGWTLQHDALGRRFLPGWDRIGAARELRTAMELAPELRMARLDLAILLGHDARGDWWASNDLKEVAQLCRDQLGRGKDDRAQEFLTTALARQGAFAEAKAAAQPLETAADRQGWTIAMDACLAGPEAALQEARKSIQDFASRHKALQEASDLLWSLRRYPEAGAIAKECSSGEGAEKFQARVVLAARLKRYESEPLPADSPVGAVLALAHATALRGFPAGPVMDLISPAQQPLKQDEATLLPYLEGLHFLRTGSYDWRMQMLDQLHSATEFGVEGSDQTGFKINIPRPSPLANPVFVTRIGTSYRVVSWENHPSRLGKEALWALDHGNPEAARAWLDRAWAQVLVPNASDPLSGHPFCHAWSKGKNGSESEIRLAASLLILDHEANPVAQKTIEDALSRTTSPLLRGALLQSLSTRRQGDTKIDRRYPTELLALYPDRPRAFLYASNALAEDGRFEEALALIRKGRKMLPDDEALLSEECSLLPRLGRLAEADALYQTVIQRGNASSGMLNNLAWYHLCQGKVTEASAELIQRAIQMNRSRGSLHTQACVLAELGRYDQARKALLASAPEEGPITPITWFAQGLIAQAVGDLDAARTYFSRVDTPDNPEDPENPTSCRYMARKRLAILKGTQPIH